MTTAAPDTATDQVAAQRAVDRITEAIALLNQVAADMNHLAIEGTGIETAYAIAVFARAAAANADLALMNARNELKLATGAAR